MKNINEYVSDDKLNRTVQNIEYIESLMLLTCFVFQKKTFNIHFQASGVTHT